MSFSPPDNLPRWNFPARVPGAQMGYRQRNLRFPLEADREGWEGPWGSPASGCLQPPPGLLPKWLELSIKVFSKRSFSP